MPTLSRFVRCLTLLAASVTAPSAAAAAAEADGDSVAPYVTSTREDVVVMMEMAQVGPGDYLIDLGAGDGRIVIAAARRGALGHGVELDGELVALARQRARSAGVGQRTHFVQGNALEADIGAATVVTLYLMPEANLRLRPRLLTELRPGTRVVSNSFGMGDWLPDGHRQGRSSGGILMWIVPARVAGAWRVTVAESELWLDLTQRFQQLQANAGSGFDVTAAGLAGDRITLTLRRDGVRYLLSGIVAGDRMEGIAQLHDDEGTRLRSWRAQRR